MIAAALTGQMATGVILGAVVQTLRLLAGAS
jgi:hypothetical protein